MPEYVDVFDEDKLVEVFLAGRSNAATRESYRNALAQLRTWASKSDLRLLELETTDIERYLRPQRSRLSPSTVGHRIGALTAFYAFAVSRNLITSSPMDGIERPKVDSRRDPSGLSVQDFQAILAATETASHRNAGIVLLILLGGLKVTEVTELDVNDVRFDGDLVVVSLRRQNRTVTLPPIVAKRLKPLVKGRRNEPLFNTSVGNGIARHYLADIVERVGRRAGLPKKLTPMNLQTLMFETALNSGVAPWELGEAVGTKDFRSFGKLIPDSSLNNEHPAFYIIRRLSDPGPLSDLQHQVDTLLTEPGVHPVAPMVVAGALLESRLRAMINQAGIVLNGKPSISSYAQALRQAGTITESERKELDLLASWRNRAAHGEDLDSLTPKEATRMAEAVSFFLEKHS